MPTLIGVILASPWINEMLLSVAALPEGKDPLPMGSVACHYVNSAPKRNDSCLFVQGVQEICRVKPHRLGWTVEAIVNPPIPC